VIASAAVAGEHLIAGELGRGGAWTYELVIDAGADVRVCARGEGVAAREAIAMIAHRARRRAAQLRAVGAAPPPSMRAKAAGKHELLRKAAVGSLTAILLHDVASSMQGLQATVDVLCEIAGDSPELEDAAKDVAAAGHAAIASFLAIRKFIRTGELATRPIAPSSLVARAVRVARSARADVTIEAGAADVGAEVAVAEVLFERILANLIATSVAASPPGGAVRVDAGRDGDRVVFTVADDGAGDRVGDELVIEATDSDEADAVGLAVAAYLAQLHGASLRRIRAPGGGRAFTVTIAAGA
jgi:two-component system sensor histidine kinase HydH